MAKKKEKKRVDGSGFGGSFGDLLAARGLSAAEESPGTVQLEDEQVTEESGWKARDWRAQVERKGRKGKTVTRLYGVSLDDGAQKALCKALGRALGCRAFVEDGEILLQGEHRERALGWFQKNEV